MPGYGGLRKGKGIIGGRRRIRGGRLDQRHDGGLPKETPEALAKQEHARNLSALSTWLEENGFSRDERRRAAQLLEEGHGLNEITQILKEKGRR